MRPALWTCLAALVLLGWAPAGEPTPGQGGGRSGLTVCATCPITSLADAVRQARPGDRIRLLPGTYREGNVAVDKPLEIVGEGFPVVDGSGRHGIITVRADGVRIRGLVVQRSGTSYTEDLAGIRVEKARACVIEGNRLIDTFFAIYLAEAEQCEVRDNEVRGRAVSEALSGNAVHLWNCADIVVADNRISGHRDGVYLEFVRRSRIIGNTSEGNLRYGLHFMFSEGNEYRGNTFRRNGAGVAVMYSRHTTMLGNRFERNWGPASYGLLLKDINDSRIYRNTFERNTVGVYAEGSNRIEVEQNDFVQNGSAARLLSNTTEIVFSHNNFIGNTFDVTTNSRQSFNSFLENYWSEYRGYDLDRNGIGDVPYRPVRLLSLLVEQYPEAVILLRSPLAQLLDVAERVVPVLTPEVLADSRPLVRKVAWSRSESSRSPSAP